MMQDPVPFTLDMKHRPPSLICQLESEMPSELNHSKIPNIIAQDHFLAADSSVNSRLPGGENRNATDHTNTSHTKSCPDSPLYQKLVDKFFQMGYDLPPTAKRERMKHEFNCEIDSEEKARVKANDSLKQATGDSYNYVYSKACLPAIPLLELVPEF